MRETGTERRQGDITLDDRDPVDLTGRLPLDVDDGATRLVGDTAHAHLGCLRRGSKDALDTEPGEDDLLSGFERHIEGTLPQARVSKG